MTGVRFAKVGGSLRYWAAASASVTTLATDELEIHEVTEGAAQGFIEPEALDSFGRFDRQKARKACWAT